VGHGLEAHRATGLLLLAGCGSIRFDIDIHRIRFGSLVIIISSEANEIDELSALYPSIILILVLWHVSFWLLGSLFSWLWLSSEWIIDRGGLLLCWLNWGTGHEVEA